MPERFVEVLDVASEASSVLSGVLARGQGFASGVRVNFTQYINATAGHFDAKLLNVLEGYNISAADALETLRLFNLTESALSTVPPPSKMPMWLIGTGTVLLAARYVLIRWRSGKILVEYGHAHAE